MTAFLIIGTVGLASVVVSLLFDGVLRRNFGAARFDIADGWRSVPVAGAFLAVFGFAGALLLRGADLPAWGALAGAGVAGLLLGGITMSLVRMLLAMPSDPEPGGGDLVGALATVVTPIPEAGTGEVTLNTVGQRRKLPASSDAAIDLGTTVVVIDVTDADALVVTESSF